MMTAKVLFAAIAVCGALAACSNSTQVVVANAPEPAAPAPWHKGPLIKGAESGQKQLISYFLSLNPDCTPSGTPVVTIVTPPAHGQLIVETAPQFPNYPKENTRSACDTQRVPAQVLSYTSTPGYTGQETVAVSVLYPLGNLERLDYSITVR
jgi:hypothetical protein